MKQALPLDADSVPERNIVLWRAIGEHDIHAAFGKGWGERLDDRSPSRVWKSVSRLELADGLGVLYP
jgi:hypothetical protein